MIQISHLYMNTGKTIDLTVWTFVGKVMSLLFNTLSKILWTEEPGGLQSMGSLRVGRNWATSLSLLTFTHWRRKRQSNPMFLPGESQGQGSLVGCRLWGCTESDTTEATQQQQLPLWAPLAPGIYPFSSTSAQTGWPFPFHFPVSLPEVRDSMLSTISDTEELNDYLLKEKEKKKMELAFSE